MKFKVAYFWVRSGFNNLYVVVAEGSLDCCLLEEDRADRQRRSDKAALVTKEKSIRINDTTDKTAIGSNTMNKLTMLAFSQNTESAVTVSSSISGTCTTLLKPKAAACRQNFAPGQN